MTTSVKKMSRGRFVCTGSLAPRGDAALDERPRRGIDGNLVDFGYYLADLSVGRRLWFSRVKGASKRSSCFLSFLRFTDRAEMPLDLLDLNLFRRSWGNPSNEM